MWPKSEFSEIDILKNKFCHNGFIFIEEIIKECKLKPTKVPGRAMKDASKSG